jgi:hypothetical protein
MRHLPEVGACFVPHAQLRPVRCSSVAIDSNNISDQSIDGQVAEVAFWRRKVCEVSYEIFPPGTENPQMAFTLGAGISHEVKVSRLLVIGKAPRAWANEDVTMHVQTHSSRSFLCQHFAASLHEGRALGRMCSGTWMPKYYVRAAERLSMGSGRLEDRMKSGNFNRMSISDF